MNILNKSTHYITTLANIQMPKIIYGTAWKKEKTTDLVIEAVLQGFRGIDTACQPKHYREDLVGAALVKLQKDHGIKRDDLFIQTKFTSLDGQDPKNIPYDKSAELSEQVYQSFEKSLNNLNTDYIDSLIMHSPMRTFEDTMIVWKIFEEFIKQGKVKQIGISNIYSLPLLQKVWDNSKIKPSVIQNRFYAQTNHDTELRKFCNSNGIIYQSFWTLTGNPEIVNSKTINTIAKKRNASNEQIFFRFVMGLGIVPLTGTTNKVHMKQDLDVLDMEDLSNEEVKEITKLFDVDSLI
jgi:diketogulonate reductase-like aldo/keto reductase